MKTKILFIIPSFRTGGAEIQLLTLLKGLDKDRFETSVAVFYQGHTLDLQFKNVPGLSVRYIKKRGALDFGFVRRLEAVIAEGFDIVQATNISARYYGIKLAQKCKVPVTIATERSARLLPTTIGSRIYLLLEKYAMRKATVVVANSQAGRNFLISRGVKRDNIRVIYNGIDPQRLTITNGKKELCEQLQIPKDAYIVGTVGRLEKQKDPFTFLNAAKIVTDSASQVRFLWVGDGPESDVVKQQANNLGISQYCLFVGDQKNVANFLNIMDLFLLTSKTIEGCSNAILEAMNFALPVIATDVGGNRELVVAGRNGELVRPGDSISLASSISRLMLNQDVRQEYGAVAKRVAEKNFTLHAMVQNYQCLYQELLKSSHTDDA